MRLRKHVGEGQPAALLERRQHQLGSTGKRGCAKKRHETFPGQSRQLLGPRKVSLARYCRPARDSHQDHSRRRSYRDGLAICRTVSVAARPPPRHDGFLPAVAVSTITPSGSAIHFRHVPALASRPSPLCAPVPSSLLRACRLTILHRRHARQTFEDQSQAIHAGKPAGLDQLVELDRTGLGKHLFRPFAPRPPRRGDPSAGWRGQRRQPQSGEGENCSVGKTKARILLISALPMAPADQRKAGKTGLPRPTYGRCPALGSFAMQDPIAVAQGWPQHWIRDSRDRGLAQPRSGGLWPTRLPERRNDVSGTRRG